jgi:radical SAM superfamily enzyme YgiQ (UPF0313 family)
MRHRVIHLINPKTDSLTTRPLYLNRALYSPLAGLLAVAGAIPRDRYEVVLTDENIESIDFDLEADLVGISAMTCYVNRGYEIADAFRGRGVPVVMGGVHASFMPQEALKHCDAVVIGEVELVLAKLLDDLERGEMRGTYKSERLHPMENLPMPRYDLIKKNRYVQFSFLSILLSGIQTSILLLTSENIPLYFLPSAKIVSLPLVNSPVGDSITIVSAKKSACLSSSLSSQSFQSSSIIFPWAGFPISN